MTGHSMFRSRQLLNWRTARWAVIAAAIPAVWACNARRLEAPNPAPARIFKDVFQQAINRDIDILFLVDTSLSMQPLQNKLLANFPTFMNVLKGLPGGLPNVHVAVVSSDLGAGKYDAADIPACRYGGDQGIFRSTPRGACAASPLNAGQTFIQDVNGMANYTGDIAAAFTCIAALGDQGCGFEHVFGSVLRALGADGAAAPAENTGFIRPNAFLSIILITNEDDCSAPLNSDLFDPGSRFVTDPLGPLASYRCNEYGHLCAGQHPPRTPAGPTDLSGTCTSAEDGRLLKVADVVARIKGLKADPTKVLVAAIAGDPAPYVVKAGPPTLKDDPNQWPYIEHSCSTATDYADPAIRVKEWVDAFGGNGVFQSICNDSFAPALQRIAEEIGKVIGSPCVLGRVLDTAGGLYAAGGAPADCAVVDHTYNDQGVKIDTQLASCAENGNTAPCWNLAPGNAMGCNGSFIMQFNRPAGLPPASDLNSSVDCSVRVCPPPGTVGKPADCP